MSKTTDIPAALIAPPNGYTDWLADLRTRIQTAQQRAALAVNRELVLLMRLKDLGARIVERSLARDDSQLSWVA